jgi:hypothetical protein
MKEPVTANPDPANIYLDKGPRGLVDGPKSFDPCKSNDLVVNGEPVPDDRVFEKDKDARPAPFAPKPAAC